LKRKPRQLKAQAAPEARSAAPLRLHGIGDAGIGLALFAFTLAIYFQVRDFAFLNYDDPDYVANNPHVRDGLTRAGFAWAFVTGHAANWHPLTWLSHMLDSQFFGVYSGPAHLTNVVIHAISAVLLFVFLRIATGARWRSAFVAFLFALHPLHLESVAWISERKDVLSALFWMITLLAYLHHTRQRSPGRYSLVIVAFALALLSKSMAVTLPLVLILLDWWPLQRASFGKFDRALLIEKIPLFAMSAACAVITIAVQSHAGTISTVDRIPMLARVENAFASYVVYLGNLIWPSSLAVIYPLSNSDLLLPGFAAAIAIGIATWLILNRAPTFAAVGWLWYLITLLPVIGLIQVGLQSHADRYTYLPSIGISIALAWGAAEIFERRQWPRFALATAAAAACAACAIVTWNDLQYWSNSVTLFQHAVEVTPGNYVALNNLGSALRHEGRIPEAIAAFEAAAAIRPGAADIHDNLGEALTAAGRLSEAEPQLTEALQLIPDFPKAHVDLASVLVRQRRLPEAESQYRAALSLEPANVEGNSGLGGILALEGRSSEASPYFETALPRLLEQLRDDPDSADLHFNVGTIFGILGRNDEAIEQFERVLQLHPDDAEARYKLEATRAARERR
jgi:tetratricopeptide (TPR) repeat protein